MGKAQGRETVSVAPIANALAEVIARHLNLAPQGRAGELANGVTVLGGETEANAGQLLFIFTDTERFEYRIRVDAATLIHSPKRTVVATLNVITEQREQARARRQRESAVVLGREANHGSQAR